MPFQSKAQQRYLFSQEPEIAAKFARETPKGAYGKLPERAKKKKKAASMTSMLTALRRMGKSDAS